MTIQIMTDTSHTDYAMIAAGMAVGVLEPFAACGWENNNVVIRLFEPSILLSIWTGVPNQCSSL
ncbi:hypothetical protein [Marinomonas sp. 2405UD68-3]|uniref:hypothetical protein n=1 Tax=Marinomonas sp. 2405UD68-3 TaxID=3391835 RepID=UPI0039C9B040